MGQSNLISGHGLLLQNINELLADSRLSMKGLDSRRIHSMELVDGQKSYQGNTSLVEGMSNFAPHSAQAKHSMELAHLGQGGAYRSLHPEGDQTCTSWQTIQHMFRQDYKVRHMHS